ncbi:unnamed protein product [Larinioides sclopetarius]|uniref:Uncharacterized protein n=1 Tax=Larinioides sclopetarius TaxID=280406 RepID=A0AAV2C0Y6_9ARAC
MKQPIIFSRVFQISCSFGRQNLLHEDLTIPALDQETCGEFLHFCPGLRVLTLERNNFTEKDTWETCRFQDFVIPDLDEDTYGEFLLWRPGLGVFTLEKFFSTEENSRVSQSTKAESEELWGQKIKPVPTTETSVIPKIKVANSSPKVEKGPIKETYAAPKPKLPRSLACILDNTNYNRSIGPRRKTKVSQEVWAASLGVKQEEPAQSSSEIQMI